MSKFKYNLAVIGLGYVGLPLAIEIAKNKDTSMKMGIIGNQCTGNPFIIANIQMFEN